MSVAASSKNFNRGRSIVNLRGLLGLAGLLLLTAAGAESLLEEGMREFEELRLRQLQTVQEESEIAPFSTDGCSGNLSQNWKLLAGNLPGFGDEFGDQPPWEDCCVTHDSAYWRGSAVDGFARRLEADRQLRQCVVATGEHLAPTLSLKYSVTEDEVQQGFGVIAGLMYRAVRLGGQPCSLLPWRWGYGWPNCAFASASDIPAGYSDIKADEQVVFFDTAAWLNREGTHWQVPIHAWIFEPEDSVVRMGAFAALLESRYELRVSADTEANFRRRSNLLLADNERGKRLVIRLAGRDHVLPLSKENGHVVTLLELPVAVAAAISDQGRLHFFAVTGPGDQRRFKGEVQLVARHGISVISDIDDTVKITNVADHQLLLDNTFFRNFREAPGMPEFYRQLAAAGARLHFVSSSPWQLYGPLQDFFRRAGFPRATLNLKDVRFRDQTLLNLFRPGTETKPAQIEPLLQRYPARRFVLIGDSGEQDPEIYGDIARRYPSQVVRILVRNLDGGNPGDQRYKSAFAGVAADKWQLFDHPGQISTSDLLRYSE